METQHHAVPTQITCSMGKKRELPKETLKIQLFLLLELQGTGFCTAAASSFYSLKVQPRLSQTVTSYFSSLFDFTKVFDTFTFMGIKRLKHSKFFYHWKLKPLESLP